MLVYIFLALTIKCDIVNVESSMKLGVQMLGFPNAFNT